MTTSHNIPLAFGPSVTQIPVCARLRVGAGIAGASAGADSPALALRRAP